MTDAARVVARIALLAFLVSSMLSAGLTLTPRAILAPMRNVRLVLTIRIFDELQKIQSLLPADLVRVPLADITDCHRSVTADRTARRRVSVPLAAPSWS